MKTTKHIWTRKDKQTARSMLITKAARVAVETGAEPWKALDGCAVNNKYKAENTYAHLMYKIYCDASEGTIAKMLTKVRKEIKLRLMMAGRSR